MELFRAIRPYQWLKNCLLFVPAILAHQFLHAQTAIPLVIAFFAFSLCASAVYVFNDICDVTSDRQHPTKRNRPLASGRLGMPSASLLIVGLLLGAIGLSVFLPTRFGSVVLIYLALSTLYSLALKRFIIIDVITLSMLYTVRLFAGSAAVAVPISPWLMAFSLFLFFSLAMAKRDAELLRVSSEAGPLAAARAYQAGDQILIETMGIASAYIAVVVYALYLQSEAVAILYQTPDVLWGGCPLLIYWTSRFWLKVRRGEIGEDPVIFAITDLVSLLVGVLFLVLILLAANLSFAVF